MLIDKENYLKEINKFTALFERSFKKTIDVNIFKWRYLHNPIDEMFVAISKQDDKIISNYSVFPCRMMVFGNIELTALSMSTMTDPDYSGHGLFQSLAKELYIKLSARQYSMVWGFPNNLSHLTFIRKLGWQDIYEIPTLHLDIKEKTTSTLILDSILDFDNDFEMDYSDCNPQANICVFKDRNYLRWRFADHPINKYINIVIKYNEKVSSYCVVKQYSNLLDIVDIQPKDFTEAKELLINVFQYAKEKYLTGINCWCPRHHFLHQIYERLGFVNREPITYLAAHQLNVIEGDIKDYSNWYIQMGDSDVY